MVQLDRKQQLVILLLVGVILFGGGYRLAQMKERAAEEGKPALEAASDKAKDLLVHVAGAVAKPGVYQLPHGSRVIDAVNQAGPAAEAELDSLKLASPVTDGQTIYVPSKSSTQAGSTAAGSSQGSPVSSAGTGRNAFTSQTGVKPSGTATVTGLVNINTADQSQLDTLPGVGPSLAQRIIQYREINGPFKAIEDLKDVSGIGDKNFEKLKDRITVR